MNFLQPDESIFTALSGFQNAHVQTLLPRILRRRVRIQPYWQRLTLPDGDFIDLAWSENPASASDKPRMVLFHGLGGSINSPYAHGLIEAAQRRGWLGVVMHFRGCSGEPNRLERIYHSGETEDASYFLQWLQRQWGRVPTAAVGVSLGGNMLACLMGKQGNDCLIDAGVVISAPLMLEPCSTKLEQGFSRFYQHYLLSLLKQNVRRKLRAFPGTLPIDVMQLKQIRRLRHFDDAVTSRAHGFNDALDYYRQASALPLLHGVRKPLLIIHAKDDPFMTDDVIPSVGQLSASTTYQLTIKGGHVGFVGGTLLKPKMWLEQRVPDWLENWLER